MGSGLTSVHWSESGQYTSVTRRSEYDRLAAPSALPVTTPPSHKKKDKSEWKIHKFFPLLGSSVNKSIFHSNAKFLAIFVIAWAQNVKHHSEWQSMSFKVTFIYTAKWVQYCLWHHQDEDITNNTTHVKTKFPLSQPQRPQRPLPMT